MKSKQGERGQDCQSKTLTEWQPNQNTETWTTLRKGNYKRMTLREKLRGLIKLNKSKEQIELKILQDLNAHLKPKQT